MAATRASAVVEAIRAAIRADSDLNAIKGGTDAPWYGTAEAGTKMPYIVLNQISNVPEDRSSDGQSSIETVQVSTRADDYDEAVANLSKILARFDRDGGGLSLGSGEALDTKVMSHMVDQEEEEVYHGWAMVEVRNRRKY